MQKKGAEKLIIFVHGGAFVSGPSQNHWDSIKTIYEATDNTIWMCDYPKAPEHQLEEVSNNIDTVYQAALKEYSADQITLIGDSAGGTLIATLTQRLVSRGIPLPNKIILISPVMDASLTNSAIDKIDLTDPILAKKGVLSAKKMLAGEQELNNPMISPLYGEFEGFPRTIMYMAENDIMYPDQILAVEKLKKAKVDIVPIIGRGMPHIWPFLPVMKEAKIALNEIIQELNN